MILIILDNNIYLLSIWLSVNRVLKDHAGLQALKMNI